MNDSTLYIDNTQITRQMVNDIKNMTFFPNFYENQSEQAYQLIKQDKELCKFIKNFNDPNGFMWSQMNEIKKITNILEFQGHSGASFGLTMRYIKKKLNESE